MPWGPKRYYRTGGLHFITWSCYHRQALLDAPARRDLLLTVLEQMRVRYRFAVIGYVVMPELLHLLVSEPQVANPSTVLQAVKLGFTQRLIGRVHSDAARHIWQHRFYDFNLWSQRKEVEKLKYMHRNPVARGLVEQPGSMAVEQFVLTRAGKMDWFGSTIGRGGKIRFERKSPER